VVATVATPSDETDESAGDRRDVTTT